jgi:AcrR family transcriptional regulator
VRGADPRERLSAKAQRTREQILGASLELFKDKGFDGTSMRDIAARAEISLGSTYYYFAGKDELVFAFYERTQADAEERNRATIAATTSFVERIRDVLLFKLEQLAEYRPFVVVLARNAIEPSRPLSPFSAHTKPLRDGAIEIMRLAVEGSDLKVNKKLRLHLPRLLWLYQMGIVFFWIHDESAAQARTRRLVVTSLALFERLLALSAVRFPGVGKAIDTAVSLLDELEVWGDATQTTEAKEVRS